MNNADLERRLALKQNDHMTLLLVEGELSNLDGTSSFLHRDEVDGNKTIVDAGVCVQNEVTLVDIVHAKI